MRREHFQFIAATLILILTALGPVESWAQKETSANTQPLTYLKCNHFRFDVADFAQFDPKVMTASWDFGDGNTSQDPQGEHIYASAGEFTVNLTVTDSSRETPQDFRYNEIVKVATPLKAVINGPTKICAGETVTWDGSQSQTQTASARYRWDLGDGTERDGLNVTHTYKEAGDYTVKLLIDEQTEGDCRIDMAETILRVNAPPKANAGVDIQIDCITDPDSLEVMLDAGNSSDPNLMDELAFHWNLGDGQTAEGAQITHHYRQSGLYQAKLKVTDNSGLACSSGTDTVAVNLNIAPKAEAGPDIKVCAGKEVKFDGRQSLVDPQETLLSVWDFGDRNQLRGLENTHAYTMPGVYSATLTVQNAFNMKCPTSTDNRIVVVNRAPTAGLKVPRQGRTAEKIIFDATQSDDPDKDRLMFYWSFGDGTAAKGQNKTYHVYEKAGSYTVTVVVDDGKSSGCSRATAKGTVLITE